jgi:adenylate cyclase
MTSGENPALTATGTVRKLAAILSADVEGYSRLMGDDEAATVQILTEYRAVIQSLVNRHRGRVVDSPGDNLLAEFSSVVDALQCAISIQQELKLRNMSLPIHRRMNFRMGINLGDVIVEGERIYGDGVNIAARIEGLAEPGGICIAGSVYDQIKTKLALDYEDMRHHAVKNIAEPVRVYRVRATSQLATSVDSNGASLASASQRRAALLVVAVLVLLTAAVALWQLVIQPSSTPPTKPSIAVLPFVNMSGDSEQEYFSDGMTEDLITDLASLQGLWVIARNSAFTYKGKAFNPQQVSRELGVRYMLEGSVRRVNNRLRITAQLVDCTTGYHVWAQSYDRDLNDIFDVQEEIARQITRALAVHLTAAEEKNMAGPSTRNQDAWKDFVEGTRLYRRFTSIDNAQARALFERAIAQDAQFVRAYANLAATHRQDWILAWTRNTEDSERQAYEIAEKAVGMARREPEPKPSLPYALEQLGYVFLYKGQLQDAGDAADEAVRRNPNYADGYALAAHTLIYRGQPEAALGKTQQAMALDPRYPFFYDYHRGHAYYVWGFLTPPQDRRKTERFLEAEKSLRKALSVSPNFRPARSYLVAVLSELGRQDEAVNEMVTVRSIGGRPDYLRDPQRLDQFIRRTLPYENQAITARLIQVWQAAEKGAVEKGSEAR